MSEGQLRTCGGYEGNAALTEICPPAYLWIKVSCMTRFSRLLCHVTDFLILCNSINYAKLCNAFVIINHRFEIIYRKFPLKYLEMSKKHLHLHYRNRGVEQW